MAILKLIFTLFFILNCGTMFAAGDITYPGMENEFATIGITENYSKESFQKLEELIYGKLQVETEKASRLFLEHAKMILKKEESEYSYFLAKRIIYTIVAQTYEGRKISLKEAASAIKKVITKIPFKNINENGVPEIRPDHFAWKPLEQVKSETSAWEKIERWANSEVTKNIQAKYRNKNLSYDLNKVRNVFFLKKIKDNATSPKITVTDAWNIKWKMKWGNEVRSEPVANRLYIDAGGKFQDLVYSSNYQEGLLLILAESHVTEKLEETVDCEELSSLETLQKCLRLPPYKFALDSFIKSSGVITTDNVDEILRKLVKTEIKANSKESLIGREYVIFKEASVEFRDDKIMERGGPIALSSVGATSDIYLRSNLLFNIWIDNYDNKDENAKSVILKNFEGESEKYIEFFHDLGASFGKEALPASLNSFEIGDSFLRKTVSSNSLLYTHFLLYRPKAWERASSTDLYWMARYLNEITPEEIKTSVSASKWPSFAQEVFVYRLQKRLYQILKFYNLKSQSDIDEIKAPNIKIPLKNLDDALRFAKL